MHKLSTTVLQSSTLTALYRLGLLGELHEYACGALRCTPCHRDVCSTSSRRLHLSEVKKTYAYSGLVLLDVDNLKGLQAKAFDLEGSVLFESGPGRHNNSSLTFSFFVNQQLQVAERVVSGPP